MKWIGIEGNPFIIRFKTKKTGDIVKEEALSIEGNPFIIRFKTKAKPKKSIKRQAWVLKVIHL